MSSESLDLAALKDLCEKATPGPWGVVGERSVAPTHTNHSFTSVPCSHLVDAQFIAASRSAVPALIAEVERLRGALDQVRRQIPLPPPNPLLGLTVDDEPSVPLVSLDADHTDTKEQP